MNSRQLTRLLPALACLTLLAAACGSGTGETPEIDNAPTSQVEGSDNQGAADGDGNTDTGTEGAGEDADTALSDGPDEEGLAPDRAEAEQSAAEFSQCLRDQGLDVPDLGIDADGQLMLGGLMEAVDPAAPETQSALLACQGSLRGGLVGSLGQVLQSQTFQDALVSFSQCVRDGGYDVPDLTIAAVAGAALGGGFDTDNPDPANPDLDSVAPILATALGLDATDDAVLGTVDGCVVLIRNSLGDLGLG